MSERIDEWNCRTAGTYGEGPYSIERGTAKGGNLQVAATGIKSYPLACAIEGIANGLDEFMDIVPSLPKDREPFGNPEQLESPLPEDREAPTNPGAVSAAKSEQCRLHHYRAAVEADD